MLRNASAKHGDASALQKAACDGNLRLAEASVFRMSRSRVEK